MIKLGATGKLIQGDVLDVNKTHLERALKSYDPDLYLKWNPNKCAGRGVWELRCRPKKKSAVYAGSVGDSHFFNINYVENGFENHVKDFLYLDYSILNWVKSHDLWSRIDYDGHNQNKITQWINDLEASENAHRVSLRTKQRDEAIYNMKQEHSAIRDYREAILSGTNPALLAHFWGQQRRK